jgi:mRNA turnover protein 4
MRNNYLKEVRQEFASNGRIFFGKTKVMAKALGTTEEEEVMPGTSKLAAYMKGDVGLLCTSRSPQDVLEYFESFSETDFARAGTTAAYTFTVPSGPIYSRGGEIPVEDDVLVPASMETQLRKWGMPTRLDKGKVTLDVEYTVCNEGDVLNSNQTALLKSFGVSMAEFRLTAKAYWSAASGEVTVVEQEEDADDWNGMEE